MKRKSILLTITVILLLSIVSVALANTPDGAYGPYADAVEVVNQGLTKGGSPVLPERSNSSDILGAPDNLFFSFGFGGDITIRFDNYISTEGALDVKVYEVTNGIYPEEDAEIWVSQSNSNFILAGTVNNKGVNSVDLPENLYWVKYVKIVDISNPDPFASNADGIDIDAVQALYDTLPYGFITKPGLNEVVSGNVLFEAIYFDDDYDALQWAVRRGTCAAATNTVFGNVDGFHNSFDWDGHLFQATADTTSWVNDEYCLVVNPTNDGGEPDIRMTQFSVINNNQPPTADPGGPYQGLPNTEISFDGSDSSDPDGDELTYAWTFGDGESGTGVTPTHTYTSAGTYNVCLTVNDGTIDSDEVCTTAVINTPPIADAGGPYLGAVNTDIPFDGSSSSDPDGDDLTYAWDFGDGNPGTGETPTHSYTTAGIYEVCLTVNDGYVDSNEVCTWAIVYDPSAGFVTGGGWINSPAEAYTADPTLIGKATFGFVAKYKKGATVPDGSTEFQFKAGDLNFHSTSYAWLVVAGDKAQFKGVGTINGLGEYFFMLYAVDGSPDTFRMKIWTDDCEIPLYDSGVQDLGGGSIVVHN
jgi:hypothetical protein